MLPSLRLTITSADRLVPPPLPSEEDPHVTPWRDGKGRLAALSHTIEDRPWLHVLNVASFRIDVSERSVTAVPVATAPPPAIEDEFRRTVVPIALQLQGYEVLHASAVRTRDGVVAFCAPSETGKSTLAYALAERGYGLWTDDALVLHVAATTVTCLPLSFEVRLREPSARFFAPRAGRSVGDRLVLREETALGPAPLHAVHVLQRVDDPGGDGDVEMRRLRGALAARALLEHAVFFGLGDPDRKRRMVASYLNLTALVHVSGIAYRSGWEHLPRVLDALERALPGRVTP